MQAASGPSQETRVGVRLMLQQPERRWGQRESSGVSDSVRCVCGGEEWLPQAGLEAASLAAGRAAGAPRGSGWAASPARRLRREPEPEWSQSSDIRAPANTCERPPGPAGGGGARAAGRGRGRAGGGAGSPALPASGPRGPSLSPALAPRSRFLPGGGLVGRAALLRGSERWNF